ncbi:hypothetical protein ACEE18_07765 [Corynebacterium freneyi]
MSPGFIGPIDLANRRSIHPDTMRSLFWEIAPEQTAPSSDDGPVADPNRVVGNPWRKMGLQHGPQRPGGRDAHRDPEAPRGGSSGPLNPLDPLSPLSPPASLGPSGPLGPDVGGNRTREAMDAELEKELWLNRVLVDWGLCGFSIAEAYGQPVMATLLFGPPRYAPTSRFMPTGPISPDAVMLTSLHIDPVMADRGAEEALIDAAVTHLAGRGVRAVEAFGCSGGGDDGEDAIPREEMSLTESILQSVDAPRTPHRCESTALGAINHAAGDVIPTRVLINSGFTVVAPHPTHPRLRRDIDPDLDWAAAVTDALDQLVAAQFYASFSASRSSTKL